MAINSDLLDDLALGRSVLFLGAGVSASATVENGPKLATWEEFLKSAARTELTDDNLSLVLRWIESGDYLLACEVLKQKNPQRWATIVAAEFGRAAAPSELHKAIAKLGQRIIITTNFDKILESNWGALVPNARYYPHVISKIDNDIFRSLKDHQTPYIIKIHGTFDDPRDMIFSRAEYIKGAFGNGSYHDFINSLLLTHTFLFIGFSMNDPAISSLMELYSLKYPSARPHYLIGPSTVPDTVRELNRTLRKLNFIAYNHVEGDGHKELPDLIGQIENEMTIRRREFVSMEITSF